MKILLFLLFFVGISTAFADSTLPEHTIVDESRLSEGMRVQINSDNENLTKEQCVLLINAYRDKGLPNGQISVHKPSTIKALGGSVLPFCVENFDGEGITFNTDYHPDAK